MAARSRSRVVIEARRRADTQIRAFGNSIRRQRLDAGISQARLAAEAGISAAYLCALEAGGARPSLEVCARFAAALGGEVSLGFYAGAGPQLRDHLQVAMLETLLRSAHGRWERRLEVAVRRPVRGFIDLVLVDRSASMAVAVEVHSQLRRFEQQLRWAQAKAEALVTPDAAEGSPLPSGTAVERLLVLRSTEATRRIVGTHRELFAAAYPGPAGDAFAALTTPDAPWPGPALLWARVEHGVATLLDRPPRGIRVGR